MAQTVEQEIDACLHSDQIFEEENFLGRKKAMEAISIVRESRQEEYSGHDISDKVLELQERIEGKNNSLGEKYRRILIEGELSRAEIRTMLERFTTYRKEHIPASHYTEQNLDLLIDCVFGVDVETTRIPNDRRGMVHLERTPASAVIEFIDKLNLTGAETLFDLGSGLGHVVYVFQLLTDIHCVGIEIEREYYSTAMNVVRRMNLSRVRFVNKDVQETEFGDCDIFFMFSPFFGQVLENVLKQIKKLSHRKPITLCSYGNSTPAIGDQDWLYIEDKEMIHPYRAAVFTSK